MLEVTAAATVNQTKVIQSVILNVPAVLSGVFSQARHRHDAIVRRSVTIDRVRI